MSTFPRGSVWRRWDLHVHTPASIVQQYGGNEPERWDAFIASLRALPEDIAVLGINDYLFIDGYEQVLARRHELPNLKAIFPVIEFRLNTFAGTKDNNKRHNFHVFFDPSVTPQTIREQLLGSLSTAYRLSDKTKWNRTPTLGSLAELGAMVKTQAPDDNSVQAKTDLQVGFENITYDRDDILRNLAKDCFEGRYLTAIGFSEWDQARWDQAAATKRTLINDAHFSLNSNDDVNKLAEHVADLKKNNLNPLLFHSSDAHALDRLGQTKLWIKSDPTFAGLKQVINQHDRAFIGDEPPQIKAKHQIIEKVRIPTSKGWFDPGFEVEVNDGLVAIIGGRGSGKSALAEMIACGAGEHDPSDDSFIHKAAKHDSAIQGVEVELLWADGTTSQGAADEFSDADVRVKYLPQKAVEALCSPDRSADLVAQIESVIFQALDETQRLGTSGFDELRANLLRGFAFEKAEIVSGVEDLNRRNFSLEESIKQLPAKKKDLVQRQEELRKLTAELPQLPKEDEKAQDQLASLIASKKALENAIVERRRKQEDIGALKTRIRVFFASVKEFNRETAASLAALNISDTTPFTIPYDHVAMDSVLDSRSAALQAEMADIRQGSKMRVAELTGLDTSQWPVDNLDAFTALIDAKANETKAYETVKLKYQQQKAKMSQVTKTIEALQKEIEKITVELTPQVATMRSDRLSKYGEYFQVLGEEQKELTKLYGPLQSSLDQGSETDRRLRFQAAFTYSVQDHLEKGLDILDRTRRGNFRDVDVLRAALSDLWNKYQRGRFEPDAIKEALSELWKRFTQLEVNGTKETISVESQLREGYTAEDFFNWLLDLRHFGVTSSLTFDGTNLYLLSPGQKGIVLLMLYLGMDKDDTRPLIIDQPEDNLDNLSVYKDLIALFRERKKSRQIILLTHNPNLVVNTDAEQVIIASYQGDATPRISYASGSLENQAEAIANVPVEELTDGIIERVCDILEGGPAAFRQRSRVYNLSPKIS